MKASEFYQLTEKPDGICLVKFCRNQAKGMYRKLCYKHTKALYRANHPDRDAYHNLKNRAGQRGIVFDLSFEDFRPLFDSRTNLSKYMGKEYQIDRIDSSYGYKPSNLQVISAEDNRAKQNEEKRKYLEKKMKVVEAKPYIPERTINEFMP